jgi:altered-inheritance-of-mitochondria protein 5
LSAQFVHPLTVLVSQTGGVTLTLSLAYLAVLTHQRNRQTQSDILRAQNSVLHALVHDPASSPASPTSLSTTTVPEHHILETAKSRWNAEIEAAVRWAQTKDWDEVREDAEGVLARLWGTVSGSPAGEEVKKDVGIVQSRTAEGVEQAKNETTQAQQTTKSALEEARAKSQAVATSAVAQAKETTKSVVEAVQVKAEQGKAAVARGFEKSKDVVEQAKVAVGLAEEKLESKFDNSLLHLNDVDRALAQRYKESRDDVLSKSVEEALAERYKPVEKQDRSKLKAV